MSVGIYTAPPTVTYLRTYGLPEVLVSIDTVRLLLNIIGDIVPVLRDQDIAPEEDICWDAPVQERLFGMVALIVAVNVWGTKATEYLIPLVIVFMMTCPFTIS